MGYMKHCAIVVTDCNGDKLHILHTLAIHLGMRPSNIVDSGINDIQSFFIAPDGSKEGWNESDQRRHSFAKAVGNSDAVEIKFGGDDPEDITIRNL